MSDTVFKCEACGARANFLRRGRCSICYLRWAETRPVGVGAACSVCGDRRRHNLKLVEFQTRWVPMCHNHAARAFQLQPMPTTIDGLRQRLARDRRWRDRRNKQPDARLIKKERRVGERRVPPGYDDSWMDAEELIIEIIDAGEPPPSPADATRIHLAERTEVTR
ncbi:MAG: hypothetical protein KC503_21600 [Myxococcales bacterium]|nr:hypothetical protein [Myxococcales bacterium]